MVRVATKISKRGARIGRPSGSPERICPVPVNLSMSVFIGDFGSVPFSTLRVFEQNFF
jgi:hypothetical protein